ncbi:MAG: cell division protein FtsQ/DivIB [Brevinematia bacterium]
MKFFKLVFVIVFSILLLMSFVVIYSDSERLKIKEVKITSNLPLDSITKERINGLLLGKSIIAIDKISIENIIRNQFDDIKEASISIYPPDSVYVNLVYRKPILKVLLGDKYKLFDEDLREILKYDNASFEKALTVIPKSRINNDLLRDLASALKNLGEDILYSKYFVDTFILDKDGVYGFNSKYRINIFFGNSIDDNKLKRAFLSSRYIIQKNLPNRYIDARYNNVIAN